MSRTMISPRPHETDEIKELKIILSTKVRSFLQSLTAEQWELLKSCTPDDSMKVQMYELLVQIVNTLSNVLLTTAWRSVFLEDDIQAYLGNLVTDAFRAALNINDNIQCDSADSLIKLINEEVAHRCNHAESVPERPKRLNMMVVHVISMLKNFSVRVKKVVTHQSAKRCQTPEQEMKTETEEETAFVEVLSMEPEEVIEPLTEENVINLDVESEGPVERMEGGERRSISGSESTVGNGKERFVIFVIEQLFTRIFHKTQEGTIKENIHILQRLIERTWAQVEGLNFQPWQKNLEKVNKIIFEDLCKQLGCANEVLLSVKREDDVIVNSIVAAFNRFAAPKATMLQSARKLFTYVSRRSRRVGVMEDPAHVEKDNPIPVFEFEDVKPDTADESEGETIEPVETLVFEFEDEMEAEPMSGVQKDAFVEVVIQKLFTRIVEKTHFCKVNDDAHILRRLNHRTWAAVQDIDFELSQKNLHNLDKVIFKDLCKHLGSANQVVLSVREEDEAVVKSIVDTFNGCATQKRIARRRIFTFISK